MRGYARQILGIAALISMPLLPAFAQYENTAPPKPAIRSYLSLGSDVQEQDSQGQPALTPDQTSLTGAQEMTLGSPNLGHSYWVPGFRLQNNFASNDPNVANSSWYSATYFMGDLSLREVWGHSEFNVNYSGGGAVSTASEFSGNAYQRVGLSETVQWKRWTLRFLDQFSRLPESPFGLGGVSGITTAGVGGTLGQGLPGLQMNYVPEQSIFTATGPRISNGFVAQGEYSLTGRSSITADASVGVLHFSQGPAIDTQDGIFSLGYNYQVSPRDTLGILYRFTAYRYPGNPQALDDQAFELAFGRRITGRLALETFVGPEVTTFRLPRGSSQTSVGAGLSLRYSLRRTALWFTYNRGLSGGSGILTGSTLDQVRAQISYRISRTWELNTSFGYALNQQALKIGATSRSENVNSIFTSAGLSHSVSRTAHISLSYTFQHQSQPICGFNGCGTNYDQHQVWIGLDWQAHPFVLR